MSAGIDLVVTSSDSVFHSSALSSALHVSFSSGPQLSPPCHIEVLDSLVLNGDHHHAELHQELETTVSPLEFWVDNLVRQFARHPSYTPCSSLHPRGAPLVRA